MSLKNGWTGGHYSLARLILGVYLAVHFSLLLPWGEALFSRYGAVPDAWASPLVRVFPNVLAACDEPWLVTALLSASVAASLALAAGAFDRAAAAFLWYVWACLVGRNPLILNPGIPFVGWILLAHACMPPPPYGSWAVRARVSAARDWSFPSSLFGAAWILMAAGYTYSGVTKLSSPSWLDGSALAHVLENPLARAGAVRDTLLELPQLWLKLATWGTLGLELAFAPLAMVRRLRPWLWSWMLVLHLLLVLVIDFADLSLGMVMLHLFTFDPGWIPPRAPAARKVVPALT